LAITIHYLALQLKRKGTNCSCLCFCCDNSFKIMF